MLDKIQIINELNSIENEDQLKDFQQKYLSKKGIISEEFKTMGSLSPEERKSKGQVLTELKDEIEKLWEQKTNEFKKEKINNILKKEIIDITTPGLNISTGHYTLLAKTRRQMEEIFKSMGFIIEYGHDLVTKYENFYSVNIPATHPATEMHDTYFLNQTQTDGTNFVMRTQTSAMQNQYYKKYGAPLKIIIPGKVYRYESTDACHDTVFWQLEGMIVDKDISIASFKDTIAKVLSAIFETDIKVRMRPAFFPFVEPGFEIDASCPICKQTGCSLCKQTGWIEILGAGMIHPNVLKEGGINPDEYKGFAFGFGLTRLVAIKYGIKDIRYFTSGDLRFSQSF